MRKKITALLLTALLLLAAGCANMQEISGSRPENNTASQTEDRSGLSFETVDVYGNNVSSSDLFAENKVTMVNIWASWCGPCVYEMPELEKLNAELKENGCGVVGILTDGTDQSGLADGLEVIRETGVTYPVILPWDSFEDDLYFDAFPTTYFVDSEGNILDVQPIVGAYVDRYRGAVEQALKLTD